MTVYQDRLPNDMASLVRRIEALERQLQQAQAARRLEAATIGRGGIVIKGGAIVLQDSDGNEIGRMGIREDLGPEPDGDPQPGFILRRNDGSIAFTLDDPDPNTGGYIQRLKIQDATDHVIFSEDAVSGWGMSDPNFNAQMVPVGDTSKWASLSTAGPSFMWTGIYAAYNPILEVSVYAAAAASTVGTVRVLLDGVAGGSTATLPAGTTTQQNWEINVPELFPTYTPGQYIQVAIEVARTSGTGSISTIPLWVIGRGS